MLVLNSEFLEKITEYNYLDTPIKNLTNIYYKKIGSCNVVYMIYLHSSIIFLVQDPKLQYKTKSIRISNE